MKVTLLYSSIYWRTTQMNDDLLSKCVIDTSKRTVYLYSDGGDKKTVACDTVDEFMNVINFVRDKVEEDRVFYSDPL